MTTLKARFDGRVLVPESPVDLPQNCVLEIHVADVEPAATVPNGATARNGATSGHQSTLATLVEISRTFPDDLDTPTDLAAQHDHYLHGMPKRP